MGENTRYKSPVIRIFSLSSNISNQECKGGNTLNVLDKRPAVYQRISSVGEQDVQLLKMINKKFLLMSMIARVTGH